MIKLYKYKPGDGLDSTPAGGYFVQYVRGDDDYVENGDDPSTLILSEVEIEPMEGGDIPTIDVANTQEALDLAAAAATPGITEQDLMKAMGEPGQGEPDFEAIAETLGVTAEELQSALGK